MPVIRRNYVVSYSAILCRTIWRKDDNGLGVYDSSGNIKEQYFCAASWSERVWVFFATNRVTVLNLFTLLA